MSIANGLMTLSAPRRQMMKVGERCVVKRAEFVTSYYVRSKKSAVFTLSPQVHSDLMGILLR